MGVSRVDFEGKTLVDLTGDTVNEQVLLNGYTAHGADGEPIEGKTVVPTKVSQLENDVGYAKTESPALTGIPTAPTPPDDTNDTQIATTAYVKKLILNLVNGAPETLDTLKEIADALGENDDAVQALNAAIGNKVDKVLGKGLSTNDFTTAEKNKLTGIENNANNYSLPLASSTVRGGAKVGYAENGKNYPVKLSNEQMYVNVPWTDNNTWKPNTADSDGYVAKGNGQANKVWKTDANGVPGWRADANTTYRNMTAATASADGKSGLVPAPAVGKQNAYLRGDGTWVTPGTTLAATVPGIPLDQTMGKLLKDSVDEINGNLGNLSGWIPYSNSFNLEFVNGIGTVDIPGETVLATSLAVWGIWSTDFNGLVSCANGQIRVNGYLGGSPVTGVQWIALAGIIKVQ